MDRWAPRFEVSCLDGARLLDYIWSPWRMEYIENHNKEQGCAFCLALAQPDGLENLIVFRGERVFAILNRYPYTSGHIMTVPFAHKPTLGELDPDTRFEMIELATQFVDILRKIYRPQGFNIGVNIGEAAGAGITEHIHLHVVPRWMGDTNFMSSLGQTRVLPESLEDTYRRVREKWTESEE